MPIISNNLALGNKTLVIDSATKMLKYLILSIHTIRNKGFDEIIKYPVVLSNEIGIDAIYLP